MLLEVVGGHLALQCAINVGTVFLIPSLPKKKVIHAGESIIESLLLQYPSTGIVDPPIK